MIKWWRRIRTCALRLRVRSLNHTINQFVILQHLQIEKHRDTGASADEEELPNYSVSLLTNQPIKFTLNLSLGDLPFNRVLLLFLSKCMTNWQTRIRLFEIIWRLRLNYFIRKKLLRNLWKVSLVRLFRICNDHLCLIIINHEICCTFCRRSQAWIRNKCRWECWQSHETTNKHA